VAHRCACRDDDSRLRRFLAIIHAPYHPQWRDTPYKRGVPPQIKRRERAPARRHYTTWYTALAEQYGAACQHCGTTETKLVLDHVIPVAKGGLSELGNMQLLCESCNTTKGKLAYNCRPPSE
jgi:5-methylcytosine-specific restriction endonuclease McrA